MIDIINENHVKPVLQKMFVRVFIALCCLYPIAMFIGYADLANTVLINTIQTIVTISLLVILHKTIKSALNSFIGFIIGSEEFQSQRTLIAYWSMIFFDIILLILFVITLLLVWGVYPQTVYGILDTVFLSGFKIGGSAFSVFYIVKAVAIYLAVYYLFKLLLFILEIHAFPYTNLDDGTKNAIRTVIGYLGLIAAIIMAVYSLGLTSTSLAFILSAFTFGISFGLKEIFNNFISGLILLIERPIKVGDWVNVGNESGEVKKIRLRSTTVETFDKKTLLIPNSQFITATVSNDLYNPVSRGSIDIECSYDDDPVLVQELLISIAKEQKGIMKTPPPNAIFTGFNASGLGFQLRFFCKTTDKLGITSKTRFAIIKAFRENNIEMPYTKQDLYIKELPSKS